VDAEAESVGIAGSFNDWRPSVSPMLAVEQGRWVKDLVLHPGTYEYCLVVDGTRWIPDPVSKEKRTNNFGLTNSVIRVSARVQ
jgi:1,4-alpha-glucan branching enzyme